MEYIKSVKVSTPRLLSCKQNFTGIIAVSLVIIFIFTYVSLSKAQPGTVWDNTSDKNWPPSAYIAHVKSTTDETLQPVYCFSPKSTEQRPLIISLHTWSGDFKQKDRVIDLCIQKDFNYIHPHFRGPNTRPQAGGSDFVIQDIDDAIDWALTNMNVDSTNIHIIGVSGGAHATLIAYMKSKHTIKTFNAYAGIYNLVDWYYESLGRNNTYAKHIVSITSGINDTPNFEEARKRSPFFMHTPTTQRITSTLNLYCGLHDGYTGSVPISQTLELYNKIVKDFDSREQLSLIPLSHIYTLLKRRQLDGRFNEKRKFQGRKIHYERSFKNKVNVLVFEGGHEMPERDSLQFIE